MHSRFYQSAVALMVLPMLAGGCVQATRHSNTMLFGTNTSFGIKVGTDTAQVPSILVGYNRQEAVIVPLVANTGSESNASADGRKGTGGSSPNRLVPCDLTKAVTVTGGEFAVHPCSLVAVNGKALDSYSVLASFGASFDAQASSAKGGLAQYFATGIAAQLLAATGGASLVATGDAATISTLKAPSAGETIAALYGDKPAFQLGVAKADAFDIFLQKLQAKMTLADPASLKAKMAAFEAASGTPIKIADSCIDADACKSAAKNAYIVGYSRAPDKFENALAAW